MNNPFEVLGKTLDLKSLPWILNMTLSGNNSILGNRTISYLLKHPKSDHVFPLYLELILIISFTLVAVIGMLANLFITIVISTSKKLRKNPSNVLVLNLMASGILMSIFCIPFTLISIIRRSWIFGPILCKIIPSLQSCSIFVCSATISIISVDRYFRVTRNISSHSYDRLFAKSHWTVIILETLIIWFFSAAVSSPIAYFQDVIEVGDEIIGYKKCVEFWPSDTWKGVYAISFMVVHFLCPTLILTLCHFEIRRYLESNLRSFSTLEHASVRPSPCPHSQVTDNVSTATERTSPQQLSRSHLFREMNRNKQVTRTLVHIVMCFTITWLPWNMFNIYLDFAHQPNLSVSDIYLILAFCHLFAMTTIPLNAFWYGWANPVIKDEALKLPFFKRMRPPNSPVDL